MASILGLTTRATNLENTTMSGEKRQREHAEPNAKNCYLCGQPGADTAEHVVPRCLYPGPLPGDMITLPAHRACNEATSRDEEAFRNFLASAIAPENAGSALWAKTWKALHRPQAQGMQAAFYRGIIARPEVIDGEVKQVPEKATLKDQRVHAVLAKIVKGLYQWKTGDVLPAETIVWMFGMHSQRVEMGERFQIHDVLDVDWRQESRLTSFWNIGFHATLWFSAITLPRAGFPRTLRTRRGDKDFRAAEIVEWKGSEKKGVRIGNARELLRRVRW